MSVQRGRKGKDESGKRGLTVLVIPNTACLAVVYGSVPGSAMPKLIDAQLTIEPLCSTRPSSLSHVTLSAQTTPLPLISLLGSQRAEILTLR